MGHQFGSLVCFLPLERKRRQTRLMSFDYIRVSARSLSSIVPRNIACRIKGSFKAHSL